MGPTPQDLSSRTAGTPRPARAVALPPELWRRCFTSVPPRSACGTIGRQVCPPLKPGPASGAGDGLGRRQPSASHRRSRMKRLTEFDARMVLAWIGKRDRRGRRLR